MITSSRYSLPIDAIDALSDQDLLAELSASSKLSADARQSITAQSRKLVEAIRGDDQLSFLDAFLAEYGLSNDEGVALLSMAEAFMRIPDVDTLDILVREKLTGSDWQSHSGHASSFLVNASTWALMITGRLLSGKQARNLADTLRRLLQRLGEPVVRTAMTEAMARMGDHFVIGETIAQALKRARQKKHQGSFFSYDMLGEAARTEADAQRYLQAYQQAIAALAEEAGDDLLSNPGISVKLSALHPRFEWLQREQSHDLLLERIVLLAEQAAAANIGLSIDAEEMRRQDFTLTIFADLARHMEKHNWRGLGAVVQAYSRYTPKVLERIESIAAETDSRFMVRLVKGAYWDTEIKHAQAQGLKNYPVFTRKCDTDVSYLAAARQLLSMGERVYPQFATHNAHTMASVLQMAKEEQHSEWEFQRLYGMGAMLHELIRKQHGTHHRIYAPVGEHEDLLAYLVRRLLENGANSSFVHQITDARVPVDTVIADPLELAQQEPVKQTIAKPDQLYGQRQNSRGWELGRDEHLQHLLALREPFAEKQWRCQPILAGAIEQADSITLCNPARPEDEVGYWQQASAGDIESALQAADAFKDDWAAINVDERSALLLRTADELEANCGEVLALLCREAGKTLADAISEWREAIDFLRFYAWQADQHRENPRGIFVCISPWNFPLAIFTGQIAAALVTGNVVLAKPAEQTPLIAALMMQCFHKAGIPRAALQLLPGDGESVGATLCSDPRVNGICFTGSSQTAQAINRSLSSKLALDATLIAETGGINAMIVDSTALPEQAVEDIVMSAFASAGQRCSALRVLYVQDDVADKILTMLRGAMDALYVGDPWQTATDVGPVIDREASEAIEQAIAGRPLSHQLGKPDTGHFAAPSLIEVSGIADVKREVFGPVLFVARYKASELSTILDDINDTGYGLTFAMHSRLVNRTERCVERLHIGNVYINRNQIGAVVQSQPFGGEGLSGTGPKAGGPHYLSAFQSRSHDEKPVMGIVSADMPGSEEKVKEFWAALDNSLWCTSVERLARIRQVLPDADYLDALPESEAQIMPGPTGERNRYSLVPLNKVLCLGPMPAHALQQAVTALAAGSAAVIYGAVSQEVKIAVEALKKIGAPVEVVAAETRVELLGQLNDLQAVCWWWTGRMSREVREVLAARDGAIVRLITANSPLINFYHERHVCNDTTRAGGNIELMGRSG